MTRLLVSVRDVPEALLAARGGADFIDLKEPREGALGGLALPTVSAIVAALHQARIGLPISATIGDFEMDQPAAILARTHAVAACGVDYVKVGITRSPGAAPLLRALAEVGHPVIPVFIADRGLDFDHLRLARQLGFPGVMVDTADKRAGCLFDLIAATELQAFMDTLRSPGVMVGLAGALRLQHLPTLARLQPDFAGFRSAVCAGERGGPLELPRLQVLAARLRCLREAAAPSLILGTHP